MENITIIGWLFFTGVNLLVVYFSKRVEIIAIKKDIGSITKTVEGIKKDLNIEEQYQVQKLINERELIISCASEIVAFYNYLQFYLIIDFENNDSINEHIRNLYKKGKEIHLAVNKLNLIIDDESLIEVYTKTSLAITIHIIEESLKELDEIRKINNDFEQRGKDTPEFNEEYQQRLNEKIESYKEKIKIGTNSTLTFIDDMNVATKGVLRNIYK